MNYFEDLFPEDLYHTYIIEGEPDITPALLREFLIDKLSSKYLSIDFLIQNHDSLSMVDSLPIKEWHSHKNIDGHVKIAILSAKFLNREAEMTLLKIFEEPAQGTHFFLVVPDSSVLLGTILSRAHVIKKENKTDTELKTKVEKFISSSPKERLDTVAEIIERNKDNEGSGSLRHEAIEFINQIESCLFEKAKIKDNYGEYSFIFDELKKSRFYLGTPGAGVKMILEHIALVL